MAVGGQTGTSSENFTVIGTAPAPAAPASHLQEGVVDQRSQLLA